MNWDAIGAVGEIFGALAVVASLAYLATQIRTSNKAVKQAAGRELMSEMRGFYSQISSDSSMAEIWINGSMNPDDLTKSQALQFGVLIAQTILIWERVLELEEKEGLDNWFVIHVNYGRDIFSESPGFRKWYKQRKHQLSSKLQAILESNLSKEGSYDPVGAHFGEPSGLDNKRINVCSWPILLKNSVLSGAGSKYANFGEAEPHQL